MVGPQYFSEQVVGEGKKEGRKKVNLKTPSGIEKPSSNLLCLLIYITNLSGQLPIIHDCKQFLHHIQLRHSHSTILC
jgi:hypothetical protein